MYTTFQQRTILHCFYYISRCIMSIKYYIVLVLSYGSGTIVSYRFRRQVFHYNGRQQRCVSCHSERGTVIYLRIIIICKPEEYKTVCEMRLYRLPRRNTVLVS